jgi:hypothetical protein
MKATINGIQVEGRPEEISKLVRLSQQGKAKRAIPSHDCDDTGPGCHICAGLGRAIEPVSDDTYIGSAQCCQGGQKFYGRCHGCQRR